MTTDDNIPSIPGGEWWAIWNKAPCGFLLTRVDGQILRINDTLLAWLDYHRQEVENQLCFQDLLPIGDRIFYETKHSVLLELNGQAKEINYNLKNKAGKRQPVLLNSAEYLDNGGKRIGYQFVILPFTDRKKYEQELLNAKKRSEEAAAAKTTFLSTITHEIRTPIHAVLNAGRILHKEIKDTDQRELLEVIQLSSRTLLELVNSVLDISKMEAGQEVIEESSFSLHQLIHDLIKTYQPLALSKDLALDLSLSEGVPRFVQSDVVKIRQVLTNLIGNSIKFTHQGTIHLRLQLHEHDDEACVVAFELEDTGIGMNKKEVKKIFEPFTQANNAIHQHYGGTGLGLSIVRGLLQILGSELTVSSQPNAGTTFRFKLRLTHGQAPAPTTSPTTPEEPSLKLNVLAVDDITSNILILKRFFKNWNIPLDSASSGQEAINKIKANAYDLILMDINMPGMDGYETSEKIRALPGDRFQKVVIIALSAYDRQEIKDNIRQSGMNGLLQKPYTAQQLYQLISEFADTIPGHQ